MINLLESGLTRPAIRDGLTDPNRPHLPPMDDPDWTRRFHQPRLQQVCDAILARARNEIHEPLPILSEEMYREFHDHGTRQTFEKPYFERRRLLGRAAFAVLAGSAAEQPAWRGSFLRKLEEIAAEDSWSVPAHVRNETGKDPMCIDLFSAETAFAVAEYLTVFAAIIPAELQESLRQRLRRCFFENYLQHGDSFFWTTHTSNWNAVCHQGVLGAALAVETDRDLVAGILEAAIPRLQRFLDGFTEDGGCTEGPGYWSYGFGWFTSLNEQLERQTPFSLFEGNPKVNRIARYGPAVSLAGGHSVNFADGSSGALPPWLLQYLGIRLNEPDCLSQAAENFARAKENPVNLEGLRNDFFHWRRVFSFVPPEPPAGPPKLKADQFLPDLQIWVARGQDRAGHLWELAAKAGFNEEHHNHNDIGSFILNVDGTPLLTEIGAPLYVKAFFRKETRYEFLAARTLGHSLPVIDGIEQENSEIRRGRILRAETGGDPVIFEADLAGAYPEAAGCQKLIRRLTFNKHQGTLWLEDEVATGRAARVEFALISDAAWNIESGGVAQLRKNGLTLRLALDGTARWDRVERHEYFDHSGAPAEIHRLVAVPPEPAVSCHFRAQLSLDPA